MAGISIWQLVIIAAIVVLLFGTKRLRGIGGDLGATIKGFKQAMAEEQPKETDLITQQNTHSEQPQKKVI
ncbi:twin-arginine translocase TatA/TatE family subunit [Motilimonas cestriensis]|uniref:Sec-independent protein translocase protein TatA n=1 Tax=Motilimonas cestriensis TaxID=2742685 RepID=A0ABS8WH38_9GAMM|nr:twin-arginine translocase TatA/TatE family subunit [Motilimonas cestriensis]MCE2596690.1 twin-arginine translocase TatA/TatE family subunit [Motilimonas cestriensis]